MLVTQTNYDYDDDGECNEEAVDDDNRGGAKIAYVAIRSLHKFM